LIQRQHQERVHALTQMNLRPFLVTVEEYIPNVNWESCTGRFKEEHLLIQLLRHLFSALRLLWDRKIVHRDLKPGNILIWDKLEKIPPYIKSRSLYDPQFYIPDSQKTKLQSYEFFS
jgi:serine/threonine protein kinase